LKSDTKLVWALYNYRKESMGSESIDSMDFMIHIQGFTTVWLSCSVLSLFLLPAVSKNPRLNPA